MSTYSYFLRAPLSHLHRKMQKKWSSFHILPSLAFAIIGVLTFPSFCRGTNYSICSSDFNCGPLSAGFPFWGDSRPIHCGHPAFQLQCDENENPTIQIMSSKYGVTRFNSSSQKLRLSRLDFTDSACPVKYPETALDHKLFNYTSLDRITTFYYDCNSSFQGSLKEYYCNYNYNNNSSHHAGYLNITDDIELGKRLQSNCAGNVTIPILKAKVNDLSLTNGTLSVRAVINCGFEVMYGIDHGDEEKCDRCLKSHGVCGYESANVFTCFCENGVSSLHCFDQAPSPSPSPSPSPPPPPNTLKIVSGIAAGIFVALSISLLIWWFRKRRISKIDEKKIVASIWKHGSFALQKYSYAEIRRITSSLSEKIGQGGYGGVYKGKLPDGRLVAVKILKISKGDGQEDFINEVASISKTSHVNVVNLYGFCFEGNKRALIYEFMPNGSLEKFLAEDNRALGMEKLYQIAIGIARGLEYLHDGCNSRIVHLDIKPHNILLDEKFCPKIADFGLAKLSLKRDSNATSVSNAGGTLGYIAPEIFNPGFGRVSHKSDIYSYGILILEIAGRKNNIFSVIRQSVDWGPDAQNLLTSESDAMDDEEQKKLKRKLIIVGLWCIQTDPTERPSMSKVIEMLEGNIEDSDIPPVPVLSFPPRPSSVGSPNSFSSLLTTTTSV